MAEYYGYAERDLQNQVNWAEVAKNVSDNVDESIRIRQEKKAAIDESTQQMVDTLQKDAPRGEDDNLTAKTLNYTEAATNITLQKQRELKAGMISPRDYMVFMNNLNKDTETLFTLADKFQQEFSRKSQRSAKGENQDLELWAMQQAEGYTKLMSHDFMPDAFNGQVKGYEYEIGDDKVKKVKEGSAMSVSQIGNILSQDYDAFDLAGAAKTAADNLGEIKTSLHRVAEKTGLNIIDVISSPDLEFRLPKDMARQAEKLQRNFNAYEKQFIQQVKANPYNLTSILTENVGSVDGKRMDFFDVTTATKEEMEAERKKGDHIIFLRRDEEGTLQYAAELSPKQNAAVEGAIQNYFRNAIDQTHEIKTGGFTPQETDVTVSQGIDKKKKNDVVTAFAKIFTGGITKLGGDTDPTMVRTALNQIEGIINSEDSKNYIQLFRTNEGISIITRSKEKNAKGLYEVKTREDIDFAEKEGEELTLAQFIVAAAAKAMPNVELVDLEETLKAAGYGNELANAPAAQFYDDETQTTGRTFKSEKQFASLSKENSRKAFVDATVGAFNKMRNPAKNLADFSTGQGQDKFQKLIQRIPGFEEATVSVDPDKGKVEVSVLNDDGSPVVVDTFTLNNDATQDGFDYNMKQIKSLAQTQYNFLLRSRDMQARMDEFSDIKRVTKDDNGIPIAVGAADQEKGTI